MTTRPRLQPLVFSEIVTAAPDRLRRKLDKHPQAAADWDWSQDGSEICIDADTAQITLRPDDNGLLHDVTQVQCTCLLSPRCFHAMAVLSTLELATPDAETSDSTPDESDNAADDVAAEESQELSAEQRAAAHAMWRQAAMLLAGGLRAAGTLLQAGLLQAIHECRCAGLHRLAAHGLAVMQSVRLLREGSAEFSTADVTRDLRELLQCAWVLTSTSGDVSQTWIGVGRRKFEPVPNQRLYGFFTEPVLTRTGYAGVVTWFMGDDGQIGTISNVRPGSAARVEEAWRTAVDLGGLSAAHQQATRSTLLLQKGTRSADGRLGGGQECRAVLAGTCDWNIAAINACFAQPAHQQLARAFAARKLAEIERPAGADLLFLQGVLRGGTGQELVFTLHDRQEVLRLRISQDTPDLKYRANIEMLSRITGLPVKCIVRITPGEAGAAALLALAPASASEQASSENNDGATTELRLPESWHGRVNLGCDELQRRHFSQAEQHALLEDWPVGSANSDGLQPLRRLLQAVVLGGRHALGGRRSARMPQEFRHLREHKFDTAAVLLGAVMNSAQASVTDMEGVRFPQDPANFAREWLAAGVYLAAAEEHDERAVRAESLGVTDA